MNEAMDFYEDMRSRHQAVVNWRGTDGPQAAPSGAASGNGVRSGESTETMTMDGQRSRSQTNQDQSPNG